MHPSTKLMARGNDVPFFTNELRKDLKSKLKNIARMANSSTARKASCEQRNGCTRIKHKNVKSNFKKGNGKWRKAILGIHITIRHK